MTENNNGHGETQVLPFQKYKRTRVLDNFKLVITTIMKKIIRLHTIVVTGILN